MGGTEKMCQLLLKYMNHSKFEHFVAFLGYEDNPRLPYFEEIVGADHMIHIIAAPEFSYILRDLQPDILEKYAAGVPEWPFVSSNKQFVKHFVSTSVFSQIDDTVDISAYVFVSEYNKFLAQGRYEEKGYVINNPVEEISKNGPNLRGELNIPEDAFVCGRIGRPSDDIFDPIAIKAFHNIVKKNHKDVYYLVVAPPPTMRQFVEDNNIPHIIFLESTTDEERLNAFHRTLDIMAHSRLDGECNSAAMFESMSCYKPVISHYSRMFNGQIDTIQNAGWVVLNNDVDEYTRILKDCVDGKFDLEWYGNNAYRQWKKIAEPRQQARKKEAVYERVLES